jgi:hypothetical protein
MMNHDYDRNMAEPYCFGEFELQPHRLQLRCAGAILKIEPKLTSAIAPLLHGLKHRLVLPTRGALIIADRAARFNRTPGTPTINTCAGLNRAQVL